MGDLLGSPRVAPLFPFFGWNSFHIYIYIYNLWNLFDLCPNFSVGCREKGMKQFRMESGVGELVGPTRGTRVMHGLIVRIGGVSKGMCDR